MINAGSKPVPVTVTVDPTWARPVVLVKVALATIGARVVGVSVVGVSVVGVCVVGAWVEVVVDPPGPSGTQAAPRVIAAVRTAVAPTSRGAGLRIIVFISPVGSSCPRWTRTASSVGGRQLDGR